MADGLHPAPLLTAAAPHPSRPGIGNGHRATGTSGSGPHRRPRTTPGSRPVGRAGSLDWSGHAGPGTEGGGRRAPGRARRGLTLDTIFLSWLSDTAMAATAPLRPRRQRVSRAGAAQPSPQH